MRSDKLFRVRAAARTETVLYNFGSNNEGVYVPC